VPGASLASLAMVVAVLLEVAAVPARLDATSRSARKCWHEGCSGSISHSLFPRFLMRFRMLELLVGVADLRNEVTGREPPTAPLVGLLDDFGAASCARIGGASGAAKAMYAM